MLERITFSCKSAGLTDTAFRATFAGLKAVEEGQLKESPLRIKAPGGVALAAVLHLPEVPSGRGAVICHGMMSYKDSPKHRGIAERLCARGHTVLRFDFSGRGESDGDLTGMTISRQVEEAGAAVEALLEKRVSGIGLIGSSMGGAVAILTTARRGKRYGIQALATMAAVGRADLLPERAVGTKGLAAWERRGSIEVEGEPVGYSLVEDTRKIDLPEEAKDIACPWLILHGERDEVIPVEDARLLHSASGGRAGLEIVPGADHRFSEEVHREHITSRIVDFIDENLGSEEREA